MKLRPYIALMIAAAATLLQHPAVCAQVAETGSYRISPPLRLAGRPIAGVAVPTVPEADPYKPRDPKKKPATVAVHGYCLVSLRDHQQWIKGSPQVQAVLGGKVYLFASPRARAIFLAAPEQYLPALDGDCLVTFAESGGRVEGQLECALIHARRVYFFANRAKLAAFQEAPDDYVNADLVEDGLCMVSKVADKQLVPGIPATVAIVDGRRYLFASAFHRQLFLQNPQPFLSLPLRNPQATAELEVPAIAQAFEVNALDYGQSDSTQISDSQSPLSLTNSSARANKAADNGDAADSTVSEEFGHNRAMSGYCPVTIRTQNTWRRGKIKYRHTFDGKQYFLAGPEELSAFQANPREYAPVLGGDSVVALASEFERVPGSVFHAFVYTDRLYLFANAEERAAFRENPPQYADADIAAQGLCLVSRVDDKREIAGNADMETLYLGMRYRFASAEYLQRFLANPQRYAEQ